MSKPAERISALEFRRKYLGKVSKDKISLNDLSVMDAPKKNKYHNKVVERHGLKFDSVLEADRWDFLLLMQRQKLIRNLQRQVWFVIFPDEYKDVTVHLKTKDKTVQRRSYIGTRYKADFVYTRSSDGIQVVEDTKGTTTPEYELKEKCMHYLLHIDIRRVHKANEAI